MRYSGFLGAVIIAAAMQTALAQEGVPPGVPPSAVQQWPSRPPAAKAVAPGSLIDSQGGEAIPALPLEVNTAGAVTYINGGIGDEELAEIKAKKNEFNVHLLLSAANGDYISDVAVSLRDGKGAEVFSTGGAGPYLYLTLPPGEYTLQAASQAGGGGQTARLTVPAKGAASLHLIFKE
ncbi:MAG: hypothetical protein KGI29_08815 [Pseudomonadota bacterium]|nr:hypothetical protein [Pseudomonadota bacterium]MDE3038596.1 hypothetical protein [Pseudomonadota bacterium]